GHRHCSPSNPQNEIMSRPSRQPLWRAISVCVLSGPLLALGCHRQAPYEGKTVAQLSAMLRDADPMVQTQGAYGLSRLGPEAKAAVPALIEALPTGNARVRTTAALALAEIGPEARTAVSALTERLSDPEWTVRRQAARA